MKCQKSHTTPFPLFLFPDPFSRTPREAAAGVSMSKEGERPAPQL